MPNNILQIHWLPMLEWCHWAELCRHLLLRSRKNILQLRITKWKKEKNQQMRTKGTVPLRTGRGLGGSLVCFRPHGFPPRFFLCRIADVAHQYSWRRSHLHQRHSETVNGRYWWRCRVGRPTMLSLSFVRKTTLAASTWTKKIVIFFPKTFLRANSHRLFLLIHSLSAPSSC